MKRFKIVAAVVVALIFMVTACGSNKVINGQEYKTVGVLSQFVDGGKAPGIKYEMIWGNVIWGVLLFSTIVGPIYFFGFSCAEPVGPLP
jgi:hypothetical protein